MTSSAKHPDLMTGPEAASYLRLTDAAGSPEAALRVLERLRGQGKIQPLAWCKSYLYHRDDLDRFVQRELASLNGSSEVTIDPAANSETAVKPRS
jgi:hypothetical protein